MDKMLEFYGCVLSICAFAGKFDEAKRMLVTNWEIHKKSLGEKHEKTLMAMYNVGLLYEDHDG
jgi:hypothetical protein